MSLLLGPQFWKKLLAPETDEMCQFLGPEIVKMGQHSFQAQKMTLWARDTLWEWITFNCWFPLLEKLIKIDIFKKNTQNSKI